MRAMVWVQVEGGERRHPLGHGDIIGRLPAAALRVDDARVSEAHALVSLRGESLRLLALRGRFRVGGRVVSEVGLEAGLRVELADGLTLEVLEVELPDAVLAVALGASTPLVLAGTTSVVDVPVPSLVAGYRQDALAVLWALGTEWRVSPRGKAAEKLVPGELDLGGGVRLSVRLVSLAAKDQQPTRTGIDAPLRIQLYGDEGVEITPVGGAPVRVGGIPGRLASALIGARRPLQWLELTEIVWPDDRSDRRSLRRRLDTATNRLRRALRDAGIDPRRVSLDGAGGVSFVLGCEDRVSSVEPGQNAMRLRQLAASEAEGDG